MMNKLFFIGVVFFLFADNTAFSQVSRATADEEKALWKLLKKESGFKKVFRKYKNYRFEIAFTQIDHTLTGEVKLKNYFLGDSLSYFYPASLVKLPLAIALTSSLGDDPFLNTDIGMKLRLDTASACSHKYENGMYEYHRVQNGESLKDIAAQYRISVSDLCLWNKVSETFSPIENTTLRIYHRKSRPSISELISEMLIYSDNESYNKLFEVMGGKGMGDWLEKYGFSNTNVTRKFLFCEGEEKSYAIPFDILNNRDVIFYHGSARQWNPANNSKVPGIKVGKKYWWGDSLIKAPRDFSDHNRVALQDAHEMIQRLVYPQAFDQRLQYDMMPRLYYKIIKDLGLYPSEDIRVRDSIYNNLEDGAKIFLFDGNSKTSLAPGIRMVNVIGQAYGFTSDCMYFTDDATDTEFFISVRIYTNKNEILGDDKYEYDEIAFPLMEKIGKILFEEEKKRKKEIVPSLMLIKTVFD